MPGAPRGRLRGLGDLPPGGHRRIVSPYATIDGVEIHRYPLTAATEGWSGYLREYAGRDLALLAARSAPRPVRRRSHLQPAGSALPRRPAAEAARRPGDLRPARPGARAVPVALRPRQGPALPRAWWRSSASPIGSRTSFIATNESYRRRRTRPRPQGIRSASSSSAARPTSSRFSGGAPDPALKQGKPNLLCYLGVMGPQDGVDYALECARRAAGDAATTTGTPCSSARATASSEMRDALKPARA